MNALMTMLTEASDVVGWALIHFLWQGTLVALLLGAVRLVTPRRFARTRYVAGCLTLLAMLVAPVVTTVRLAGGLPGAFEEQVAWQTTTTDTATPAASEVTVSDAGPVVVAGDVSGRRPC